jgi:hypothetical protein
MAENLEYRIKVLEDQLSVTLEKNKKSAVSLGGALETAIGVFTGTAAVAVIGKVGDAFSALGGFIGDSIREAADGEAQLNKLQVALSQTGQLTEVNVKRFEALAESIQASTTVEDDAVISSAALLQSIGKLSVDGLERATKAAIELSAAYSIDLEDATRRVAAATNGNITGLNKLGIEIQKGSSDAETFANALAQIEKIEGAAAAKTKTFSGALAQLDNTYSSVKESVGNIIVQNPAVIAAFNVLKDVLLNAGKAATRLLEGFNFTEAFNVALSVASIFVSGLDNIFRAVGILFNSQQIAIQTVGIIYLEVFKKILDAAADLPFVGDSFKGLSDKATAAISSLQVSIAEDAADIKRDLSGETLLGDFSVGIDNARKKIIELAATSEAQSSKIKNSLGGAPGVDDEAVTREQANQLAIQNVKVQGELDTQNALQQIENIKIENSFARQEAELQRQIEFDAQKLELEYQAQEQKIIAEKEGEDRRLALQKLAADKELAFTRQSNAAQVKEAEFLRNRELQIQQARITAVSGFIQAGLTLAKQGSREAKVLATADAIVNTYAAGLRAYRDYPYPANLGVLAATIATGLANVAKINSAGSFATGGFIGGANGASMGGDNTTANVRTGELVLNANQQKQLFDQINGGGSSAPIIIQIDGREVFRAVRDQLNNGMKFA